MFDFTIKNITVAVALVLEQRWRLLLTAAAIPAIGMFAIGNLAPGIDDGLWFYILVELFVFLFQAVLALITHRITLIPDAVPPLGLHRLGAREFTFLAYFTGAYGAFSLFLYVFSLIGAAILAIVIGIWLLSRFSLCFPAIAVGDRMRLEDSWALTAPHQGTMLMVVLLFPLVVGIIIGILKLLLPFLSFLLEPVATVITVIALSIAYVHIRPSSASDQQVEQA